MLPSPLGLLEYDVLEDAVFLGPGRKGGLRANPTPFKGASVALTKKEGGYVARPLPGESAPQINGEDLTEKGLEDGDRIRIGDQVALFRTERGLLRAPAAAPAAIEERERPAGRRRESQPVKRNPMIAIITLTGLALLLAATYRAVNHLKAIQGSKISQNRLPELEDPKVAEPGRALRELMDLNSELLRTPHKHESLLARYRSFQRRHAGTAEAESAAERIRELLQAASAKQRKRLDTKVASLAAAQQYARALAEIRTFEARFGTTAAAEGLDAQKRALRTQARASLDQLLARVGPLITPQPREAHRLLIGVSHEYPADMTAEVIVLIERCVARMMAIGAEQKGRGPRPPRNNGPNNGPNNGGGNKGDPSLPPLPGGDEPPPKKKGDGNQMPDPKDMQCRDAWGVAFGDLKEAKYAEALQGYTVLIQQYGNTAFYRTHKDKIMAGRYAAKVGALGPEGLLHVPVEKKKRGRLEMEYHFNDQRVFEQDFTVEQPFSSAMEVKAKWKRGSVVMERATGLFHRLVFLPDVRIEATVHVQMPHDFGMIAVEESDDFRAILFNIANTQFKLKKGAAATVNKGHLLWYIGQGVWSAADKDAHGFIKIAERGSVKLKGGDKLKVELSRSKDSAQGSFQGKTDGVNLEGKVKGDDGSTMGSARVGLFTNSGIIIVESVRISGVVDMEWFRKELSFLVAADPGPPN